MNLILIACMVMAGAAGAADTLASLEGQLEGTPPSEMMKGYLTKQAMRLLEERKARYETLKTEAEIQAYQQDLHAFFVQQLGGFPERTPMNPQLVGQGETEWFRYEKIIFESRPQFYVTAILYLPKTPGPWPGIIVPCGHSANGKGMDAYQCASMLLAANGMAALCYDPLGQGERYAFLKEDGTCEFGTTLEHTILGVGAILTGTNTAGYRVWDGMRAIDYLQSRPDIIPERIGCTGNSGGGTLTSYLMALDDRILCAAPSCYITNFERLLSTIGPQDAEQNIFGQIAKGLDHPDYIHLRAPRPTLICAATEDFFDITGTWQSFREAKRLFSRLGYSERVDLIENADKHGFNQPQREAAARWMSRWLLGKDQVITEPEFTVFTDEEIQCTPEGQVMLLDGAVSVLDLNRQRAQALAEKRAAYRNSVDDETFRQKIRELIGMTEEEVSEPESMPVPAPEGENATGEMVFLKPEPGILLRVVLVKPASFTGDYVILCQDKPLEAVLNAENPGTALLEAGHAVCWVELRGMGETTSISSAANWEAQVGADWQDYFLAYLLGKSYVGMRVKDIYAVTDFLRSREERPVRLFALGRATVPALHAAALSPERFSHTTLQGGIPSWTEVVNTPRAKGQLINAVHDVLSWYDLPDLINLLPPEAVTVTDAEVPEF